MGEQLGSEIAKDGNISLILDSYQDLFSDFDPRPYSEKALSEDFLEECNRAARDKRGEGVELRLMIPAKKRSIAEETKIKKRLKNHFFKHFKEKEKEIRGSRGVGLFWVFLGTIIMVGATFLYRFEHDSFLFDLLFVILEPAGWFTFWEGLHQFFLDYKTQLPNYHFYKKMSRLDISFVNY